MELGYKSSSGPLLSLSGLKNIILPVSRGSRKEQSEALGKATQRCGICGKVFQSVDEIIDHIDRDHLKIESNPEGSERKPEESGK